MTQGAQLGVLRSAGYAVLEMALRKLQYNFAQMGDAAFKPPAILERKVAEKGPGLKSGRGSGAARISELANSAVMNALKNL